VETDHESLKWLLNAQTSRLVRCRLSEFDFTIKHIAGKRNIIPDALSRLPTTNDTIDKHNSLNFGYGLDSVDCDEIHSLENYTLAGMTLDVIREAQRKQSNFNDIMTNYRNATESKPYEMENGILYRIFKNFKLLMIPSSLEETVLNYYHQHASSVQMSRDRLWNLLKTRFYWPSMYTNVKVYLQNCLICAQIKTRAPKHHGLLQPIHVQRPFELIGVDIVILRVSTGGFQYVLVGIDYFTSCVEAAPMKTLTAEEVIRVFFQIIVSRHGCPERLISDSGVQFTSFLF
jgi:hypothetical protein